MGITNFSIMKYLIKTIDSSALDTVDYTRVIWDTTDDNVLIQNTNSSGCGVNYNFVDLGLPSGLLWADKNIGAETPEETGLYFQWGDVQGYTAEQVGNGEEQKPFEWSDYKFSIDGSSSNFSKYNNTDGKTVLDLEDDAAHALMGGNWRMPTQDDFHELISNTNLYLVPETGEEIHGNVNPDGTSTGISIYFEWEQPISGTIKGMKFYKKNDEQTYLFVPCGGVAYEGSVQLVGVLGFLWSSSLYSQSVQSAWVFEFNGSNGGVNSYDRFGGFPVRGVLAK